MILTHPFARRAASNQVHLRIMGTTDLHAHVMPYDYYADCSSNSTGLARTASIIKNMRAEAQNSILVDNGDLLQGTPLGDYFAYERGMKEGDTHPIIDAMNAIGYDATTLGNHEFNYGLSFLMKSLSGAKFPIVSANVVTKRATNARDDRTLVKPYVILTRQVVDGRGIPHTLNIGIIGFTPPQIVRWDSKHLDGSVETRDIVASARDYVPQMKEEGADIIVALSHSGIGATQHTEFMENASVPLAAVDGIDALITGHSHLVFPSPIFEGSDVIDAKNGLIHGKPAVMAGLWGSHLGLIDLLIERDAGAWRVAASSSQTRPIADRDPTGLIRPTVDSDPIVAATATQPHNETLQYIRRSVGKTTTPLHSYFARVMDCPSVQVIANAQLWYMRDMFKNTPHEGLPILSAVAPFKTGGRAGPNYFTDVPAGDLAIKNVADLYFFPNTICAVRINGAQLTNWIERSAGLFQRVPAGAQDHCLINREFPAYNFDIIDGVSYEIDISQPPRFEGSGSPLDPSASRVKNLEYNGTAITDDMEFIVITNNYRASGGGCFAGADGTTIIFEGPDTNRDILLRYISEHGTISPKADRNWRFTPLPDTSVIFETGPKAIEHLDEQTGLHIEHIGPAHDGFESFRIRL